MSLSRKFLTLCSCCRKRLLLWTVVVVGVSILFCSVAIIKWKNGETEHEYLVPVGSRRRDKDAWSSLFARPEGKRRHAVSDVVTTEPAGTKRTPNPRRYVLGMNYWEQFTNAVTNFFALACIADQWDASIIQPYTAHSRLYGLDNLLLDDYINSSDRALDLGLILDPASMDSVLRERGLHSHADHVLLPYAYTARIA